MADASAVAPVKRAADHFSTTRPTVAAGNASLADVSTFWRSAAPISTSDVRLGRTLHLQPAGPPSASAAAPDSPGARRPIERAPAGSGVDRESYEKARIAQRSGAFAYHHPVNDVGSAFETQEHTSLFLGPAQRFTSAPASSSHTSAEASLRREQDAAETRKLSVLDRKRRDVVERERERWAATEAAANADAERVARDRDRGLKAKRGMGSVPFDLISHAYTESAEARAMRAHDDAALARAHARTRALAAQQNKHGHNPITGAPV